MLVQESNIGYRKELAKRFEALNCEAICSGHEDALLVFLEEEPDIVMIFEVESEDGKTGFDEHSQFCKGFVTLKDIEASAPKGTKIIALGFTKLQRKDYMDLPLTNDDIKKIVR